MVTPTAIGGRALSDAAKLPEPGDLLGDFELLSTIGRGGFGAVYKAHQRRVDREA
ncbi:MAG: hypothetical protein COW42_13805, partial [Deltaproteobacteria bacterium CG17_big_fil_post_rev_8_21_14_2_50_63_7]